LQQGLKPHIFSDLMSRINPRPTKQIQSSFFRPLIFERPFLFLESAKKTLACLLKLVEIGGEKPQGYETP